MFSFVWTTNFEISSVARDSAVECDYYGMYSIEAPILED